MTTIVAYVEPGSGRTWVGADSRGTQGEGFVIPTVIEKLINIGPWWVGVSGTLAAIRLISANTEALRQAGNEVRHIVAAVHELFRAGDWRRCTDHPGPPCFEQYMTLVRQGAIYAVSGTGTITAITPPFWADGSGRDYALGAMHAVTNNYEFQADGRALLLQALHAAARYDSCTGEPFFVEEVL